MLSGRFRVVNGCSMYCWTVWWRILSIFYVLYKVNNLIAASFPSVDCLEALFGGCLSNQTVHCCEKKKKINEGNERKCCLFLEVWRHWSVFDISMYMFLLCLPFLSFSHATFTCPLSAVVMPSLFLFWLFFFSFVQDIWWDKHSWNVFSLIICLSAIIMLFSLYK